MNHQVLARKWRPHNFTEVVGQQHVVKALTNALQHDRLHHAYLFTGTRGVGKTTIARILAKALNCEDRTDYNPCGKCAMCRDLDEGRFIDLIEVDAASRTRVEDTRELLENALYAPNQGKYKVYLIDEVHMLSGHSFNALLKTLEEPPPHVKFLLATTDPQKIPVTVLSRCLQFNLKRLLPDQISSQMQFILGQEGIDFEQSALRLLAHGADGSMRDGLSLLDQAIVYGNGKVMTEEVSAMLGTITREPVDDLLRALARSDAVGILQKIAEMAELAPDFDNILQQLLFLLHRIALVQVVPAANTDDDADVILALAALFSAEEIQLYYQIGLLGQKDLELAPDPRGGFEMVMLRMLAFRPSDQRLPERGSRDQLPKEMPKKVVHPVKNEVTVSSTPVVDMTDDASESASQTEYSVDWTEMIKLMKLGGITRELANNCVLVSIDDKKCLLLLNPTHKQLLSPRTEARLLKALQSHRGKALKLSIDVATAENETPAMQINKQREHRLKAAEQSIDMDENIQALKDHLDARVVPGSIEPR
jgi:DNA polymerase-3 subunit gamma/tau